MRVIDSAEQCAEDVARRLAAASALKGGLAAAGGQRGWLRCFVTDDAPRFAALASRFLGEPIEEPRWVPPEVLYAGSEIPAVAPLRVPA